MDFKLKLHPLALADMQDADAWWRANSAVGATAFTEALKLAFARLSRMPRLGVPLRNVPRIEARRLVLPEVKYCLYYRVDEAHRRLVVLRVWHTSRGGSPL